MVTDEWSGPGSIAKMGAAVEGLALVAAAAAITAATKRRRWDMKISSPSRPVAI
jgi:hypothetical protein